MSRKGKKKPSESRSRPENPPGSSDTADLCGNALDSRPRSRGRSSSPFKRYVAAAVCVFLLLAVALVFGQTVRHEFIAYDDDDYVCDNPQVARGFTAQGIAWAFTHIHAGNWHPLTWLSHMLDCQLYGAGARRRASPDQRPAARRHCDLALPGPAANDRRSLAQRLRGGPVRHPSVARGIGGLGGGAEGRPQRTVLHADLGGLRGLRPPSVFARPLSAGDGPVCPGPDGQADAGDVALCAAAVGLLAAGKMAAGGERGAGRAGQGGTTRGQRGGRGG